jgi:hypothetical protein
MLELQKLSLFFCAENLQMTVYRHETADSLGCTHPQFVTCRGNSLWAFGCHPALVTQQKHRLALITSSGWQPF